MWTAETVLVCALTLLGRTEQSFPPIQFVEMPPSDVSSSAEAFVRNDGGRIYLVTSTSAFRRAQRAQYRCNDIEAIRKIASVLIHEEWHLKHGSDEAGAYTAQLSALTYVGAGPTSYLYAEVMRSRQAVLARSHTTESRRFRACAGPCP